MSFYNPQAHPQGHHPQQRNLQSNRQQQQHIPSPYAPPQPHLQFYSSSSSAAPRSSFPQQSQSGASDAYNGGPSVSGSISSGTPSATAQGPIVVQNWYNAFTPWTGSDDEPPLLEELGINFIHIRQKSLAVLNPLGRIDSNIMDDADLAGPLVFCFIFGTLLLFSGKPQFSYIYGVALVGSASLYALLNLMSESGIDAYRTSSVLGYCLLPLILLSLLSVFVSLDGTLGYALAALTIAWCSFSASSIFASVLRLQSQRVLVAYPVALLYTAFSLLSIFDGTTGGVGVK